jgi:glycerophosphoryl diester phosphodiesterase
MKAPQFFADAPEFINLGHRGGCRLGPENTLEAALCGFRAGAHGWELDVGLSKDGVPMLLHDDSLERTTDAAQEWPGRRPWSLSGFRRSRLLKNRVSRTNLS